MPSEETPLISEAQEAEEDQKSRKSIWREFVIWGGALAFVLGTGAVSWALDQYIHKGQPREPPKEVFEWKSQVLGWISAILYRKCHLVAVPWARTYAEGCRGSGC